MNKSLLRGVIFTGLFLIPFIPFLVSSSLFFPFITTKAFAFRFIVEVVFAAWLVLAFFDVEYRPKKSRLLYALFAFLGVVVLADVFSVSATKSIWSNFERMEGLLTMLHLGALFLVMSTSFRELDWKRWWNTSLVASFLMVCYCLLQIAGVKNINQGGVRVDGTFGNAIYLAVYMLFHIFIALLYMVRAWKNKGLRLLYGILILLQVMVLYFTATRGAALGLLGGLIIFALLNLRNREERWVKKLSAGVIAALVLMLGGFFAMRDAQFVQQSPVLSRFATLSLSEWKTQGRAFIWPMAWEGIKERPILGWGQENFGHVFQKHYRPEMYNLEPWFDRAHNVFLDWAIAGGLFALGLYLSLYALLLHAIWRKAGFSYLEKSILTALLAAYFFHNLFVFDHLYSYILFFSFLAYVESRSPGAPLSSRLFSPEQVRNLAVPGAALLLLASLFFFVWKPLSANTALIRALISVQSGNHRTAIASFERAYRASALGRQEAVEQMVTHSTTILGSPLPLEERNRYFNFAKSAVIAEAERHAREVRTQLLAGMFMVNTGSTEEGIAYLERAKALAPTKQEIYLQSASAYLSRGDMARALADLKAAYDLAPEYARAKTLYLVGAIYAENRALERELLAKFGERELAFDDTVLSAYYERKRFAEVIALVETRKKFDPARAVEYDAFITQVRSAR